MQFIMSFYTFVVFSAAVLLTRATAAEPPYQRMGEKIQEKVLADQQHHRALQAPDATVWPECDKLFFIARDIGEEIYGVEMDCLCSSGVENAVTCTTRSEICCGSHCGKATNTLQFTVLNEVREQDLRVDNFDLLLYEEVCFTYTDIPEGEFVPVERCVKFYACTPQREGHTSQCRCDASLSGQSCSRCSVCTEHPTNGNPMFAAVSDCLNVRNDPSFSPSYQLCDDLRSLQEVSSASLMYCLPAGETGSAAYTGGVNNDSSDAVGYYGGIRCILRMFMVVVGNYFLVN